MRHTLGFAAAAAILFGALVCAAWAQQQPGKKETAPPPPQPELADPTKPSQKMKDLLNTSKNGKTPDAVQQSAVVFLRGRVIVKDQPAVAVLEVNGKTFTVEKGSILAGGVLRVIEINSTEVRLENVTQKDVMVLR